VPPMTMRLFGAWTVVGFVCAVAQTANMINRQSGIACFPR